LLTISLSTKLKLKQPNCSSSVANAKDLEIKGDTNSGEALSPACTTSVDADFATRDALPVFTPCTATNSWGPQPNIYPAPEIEATCDIATWQRNRFVKLIEKFVSKGWNYCHHHSPTWMPPANYQIPLDPSQVAAGTGSAAGVCSSAGITATSGWTGVDCSHYSSWVYNYGFGAHLESNVNGQACGPNAPGKSLPFTAAMQDKLLVGDLLYIAADSSAAELKVSHVIMWTGIEMTWDLGPFSWSTVSKNIPANQLTAAKNDANAAKAAGKKVYIISDSHNVGPAYRPFVGWWSRAFTFARRLIGLTPTDGFTTTLPGQRFDPTGSTSCYYTRPATK